MRKKTIILSSITLSIAVALGAMGAHMLEAKLSPKLLTTYKTGVTYQFYHGLALLVVGVLKNIFFNFSGRTSTILFSLGIILFCGGIYCYTLTEVKLFVHIVPIGGISFMLGWLFLALEIKKINLKEPFSGPF